MFDSREQTVEALTVLPTVNPMTATRKTSLGTKRTSFGTLKRLTLGTRVSESHRIHIFTVSWPKPTIAPQHTLHYAYAWIFPSKPRKNLLYRTFFIDASFKNCIQSVVVGHTSRLQPSHGQIDIY